MDAEELARLEAILENAVDAIITIDERGSMEFVNPATERMFGYTAQELMGKNVSVLMPTPYHEKHDGYLRNYRETGVRQIIGIGREVLGRRKDGTEFHVHLAVSEFHAGNRRLFTGIVRDISDLKHAEAELRRLNENLELLVQERTYELRKTQAELVRQEKLATLGQLSAGIAHEIRNPLNALKTSAYYLLNAENVSPEKSREHLERIDRQVTMIANVVTGLSNIALMPEPNLQPVDVGQHVQAVLESIEIPASIDLMIRLPDESRVLIHADEFQVPIVLRNLIRNACDAMPEGGTLTIGASDNDYETQVFVQDTGTGMAEEVVRQITEPLYSTKTRGMGLGLAIVQILVEKNSGQLHVESELGKGSKFSVVFPRNDRSGVRQLL